MATAYTTDTSTKVMMASQPNSMPASHFHSAREYLQDKKLHTLSFPHGREYL